MSRVREGAADTAAARLVRVQPRQLSMSDVKRRHLPVRVAGRAMRGVKGLAAGRVSVVVGAVWGAARVQEPEGDRVTAAAKYGSPRKLRCGDRSARRTRCWWGEAGVLGEAMGKRSRGARRGIGPGVGTRVAGIVSGRAICRQGLAAACKDRVHDGHAGGAGRVVVWRMSPYQRRRGGNAPPSGLRGRPGAGNARPGQGGFGHLVARTAGPRPDAEPGSAGSASWRRGGANSTASGRP